jgi:hypothetical protein
VNFQGIFTGPYLPARKPEVGAPAIVLYPRETFEGVRVGIAPIKPCRLGDCCGVKTSGTDLEIKMVGLGTVRILLLFGVPTLALVLQQHLLAR